MDRGPIFSNENRARRFQRSNNPRELPAYHTKWQARKGRKRSIRLEILFEYLLFDCSPSAGYVGWIWRLLAFAFGELEPRCAVEHDTRLLRKQMGYVEAQGIDGRCDAVAESKFRLSCSQDRCPLDGDFHCSANDAQDGSQIYERLPESTSASTFNSSSWSKQDAFLSYWMRSCGTLWKRSQRARRQKSHNHTNTSQASQSALQLDNPKGIEIMTRSNAMLDTSSYGCWFPPCISTLERLKPCTAQNRSKLWQVLSTTRYPPSVISTIVFVFLLTAPGTLVIHLPLPLWTTSTSYWKEIPSHCYELSGTYASWFSLYFLI